MDEMHIYTHIALLFRLVRHSRVDGRSGVEWDCGELGTGRVSTKKWKKRWMQSEHNL